MSALLFGALTIWANEPTTIIVVAHADVPVGSLSREACSALFLKEQRSWSNGTPVVPFDLMASHPARETFSQEIHQRSVASIKRYWQRMLFSGRETPPVEVTTPDEMVARVRATPGAIGYVVAGTDVGDLETLTIVSRD